MTSPIERFLEAILAAVGVLAMVFGLGLIIGVSAMVLGPWGSGGLFDLLIGGTGLLLGILSLCISVYMVVAELTWAQVSAFCEDLIMLPFIRFVPGWTHVWSRVHYGTSNMGRHGQWTLPAHAKATPNQEYYTHAATLKADGWYYKEGRNG